MNRWLTKVAVVAVIIVIVAWFIWGRLKGPQSAGNESSKSNTTSQTSAGGNNGQAAAAKSVAAGGATDTYINESKWSEARAAAGTIATAIRAYCAEVGPEGRLPRDISALGLTPQDLNGVYFGPADYTFTVSSMSPLAFTVTCTPGAKANAPKYPAKRTLDSDGKWGPE